MLGILAGNTNNVGYKLPLHKISIVMININLKLACIPVENFNKSPETGMASAGGARLAKAHNPCQGSAIPTVPGKF